MVELYVIYIYFRVHIHRFTHASCSGNVNGMQEMLIVLSGTIPTYFRGATYQTPVHVIVPYNYPMGVPSIYVKPTPTMIVQPRHRYVNQHDGRVVNLPYLNRWNVRGCLVDAILAVQSVFNSAPPLYAKPASTVSWAQNQGRNAFNNYLPSHQRPPVRPTHQRKDSSLSQIKTMLVQQLSSSLARDITQRFSKLQVEINKEFKNHADLCRREDAIQSGIVTLTKQKQELSDEKQKCERELKEIEDNNQVAIYYCSDNGKTEETFNPNGSIKNIAGIFNKEKNVLGMMPHPERMIDQSLSGEDGSLFFKNLINNIK